MSNVAAETLMRDHVERFWRILETETVRILIDMRRDTSSVPYWDSSSFPDAVAKALVAERLAAKQSGSEQAGVDALREALTLVAQSGKFQCFDDAAWDIVNTALAITPPAPAAHVREKKPADAETKAAYDFLVQKSEEMVMFAGTPNWQSAYHPNATPPAQPAPASGTVVTPVLVPDQNSASGHRIQWMPSEPPHGKPDGAVLPKRPFAFAVRRAPENGEDQWRLFMDEGEARAEAEQLDGDYECLFRVGDRRSAVAALTVADQIASTVRVWLECPAEKRPSAQALGIRVAEIAALSPKIAVAETSPGDVVAVKEACKRVALEAFDEHGCLMFVQHHGWAGLKHKIAAAIDRLDVKAEAKSQEPEAVKVSELYLNRTEVRRILIGQPDENLDITEGVLADIDDLPIFTAADLIHPTTKPEAPAVSVDAIKAANKVHDLIADLQGEHEATTGPFDASKWKIEVPVADLHVLTSAIAALIAGER